MAAKRAATPIHLEGTALEGGGQLVRIALGLSSLSKKPVNITNIRGKRSGGGGLKVQHLTSAQWLGQACNARLSGMGLKSKEITFRPDQRSVPANTEEQGNEIHINQNTPGSINLIFQAIFPYLLFSGSASPIHVRVTGGTNVSNSPSYDYIHEVLIPMLALIGIPPVKAQLHSRGWSQGTTQLGSITYIITPLARQFPAFQLTERGEINHVKAIVIAPRETEQQFRDELQLMFEKREDRFFSTNTTPRIDIKFSDSHHEKRYFLLLVATTTTGIKLGRDWLYDQAIRPGKTERIVPTMVKKVSNDLLDEIAHGGCVDEYLWDQLVVFQALAEGRSQVNGGRNTAGKLVQPSLHAKTAMWVAEKMLGVEFDEDGGAVGIGFRPGGQDDEGSVSALAEELMTLDVSNS
jgi:RNA 3'-terminal phosphate cyclase (ATP)